jgi:hypothetical protein
MDDDRGNLVIEILVFDTHNHGISYERRREINVRLEHREFPYNVQAVAREAGPLPFEQFGFGVRQESSWKEYDRNGEMTWRGRAVIARVRCWSVEQHGNSREGW